MGLGGWNHVRGTGGRWHYGLIRYYDDGSATVEAYRKSDGESVGVYLVSRYRTTTLARLMGDSRPGYETEIRKLIKNLESNTI